ncbi:MAG: hypothetical protein EHM20_13220 [Alphaproteobacteria bacterium]|nr:MAG: hypothetical protein EHM20_13220 [Alphaproteobacteria bacterium]
MSILKYKSVDISKVNIGAPVKTGKTHYSAIHYETDSSLIFQTPEIILEESSTSVQARFQLINKGYFFTLLEDLQNRIVDRIYTNSKTFFNGKEFSEDRIRNSLKKIFVLDDNGEVIISSLVFDENVRYFDSFRDHLPTKPEFPLRCVCIFSVDKVLYDKRDIVVPITVTHVKIGKFLNEKKVRECILDDYTEEEVSRSEANETCTSTTSSSNSCGKKGKQEELCTTVKNTDNLDFFE